MQVVVYEYSENYEDGWEMTKVWEMPVLFIRLTNYLPTEREVTQEKRCLSGSRREVGRLWNHGDVVESGGPWGPEKHSTEIMVMGQEGP